MVVNLKGFYYSRVPNRYKLSFVKCEHYFLLLSQVTFLKVKKNEGGGTLIWYSRVML